VDRREFLRVGGALGATAAIGSALSSCVPATGGIGREYFPPGVPDGNILDVPASEAPIDHVVVLMMENRSFDHYLGWLGRDEGYLDRGRRNYGDGFSIDARPEQTYLDANGAQAATYSMGGGTSVAGYRGCGFGDPGHGWGAGRVQRDHGFVAAGSGNDLFALGYQEAADLPFHARMARRFTTFDRYHCSLLGPTQPNRRYLHSAQSGGYKNNYLPIAEGGHQWDTIWDRLRAARVDVRSYSPDLPSLAFWGARMAPILSPVDQYFTDCATGNLPSVTFLDPPYLPWWQADDHPLCDPAAGQRYLRDVFRAFVESPHWRSGLFVLTYDEWGGFFDHVAPPTLPDLLASPVDDDNFGQAGFRVPTILASPYARPGFVDHRTYDHTSIMRFLEWRFLGAPAEGPGGDAGWSLTPRDRNANNIGASLGLSRPDPQVFDLDDVPLRAPTEQCAGSPQLISPGMQPDRTPTTTPTTAPSNAPAAVGTAEAPAVGGPGADMLEALDAGYFERVGVDPEPSSMAGTWAAG
jgi:phospholipase C